MAEPKPSDIAREAFKQLALRRLQPTPENYRTVYDEIAGVRSPVAFPDSALRQIERVLPAQTPAQRRLHGQFGAAIEQRSWVELQRTIVGYANLGLTGTAGTAEPPASADAADAAGAAAQPAGLPASARIGIATVADDAAAALPAEVREQVARLIEHVVPTAAADDPQVATQAEPLLQALRSDAPAADSLRSLLANFGFRLSFATETQAAVRNALLGALHELLRNIAVLSPDDRWLQGQAQALVEAASPPLELRRLDSLQTRLRDVVFKQAEARSRAVEAQEQLRQLLSTFIDRLSAMSEKTGAHRDRIEACASRIETARSIEDIAPVLQEVIGATRAIALDSQRDHDELAGMRERSRQAGQDMERLREALDRVSAEARHDPLTGALNRKGMDEALSREVSRAHRAGSDRAGGADAVAPLCIAMLDIDNFKQLNDRLGHEAGDAALVHLARVAREAMRPQDVLARYGGEEFVILLPDTVQDAGVAAMQRLQRELTRRFFLRNNDKVLITFSAGVAQVALHEDPADALRRADQAMYLAKRGGKNRVLPG